VDDDDKLARSRAECFMAAGKLFTRIEEIHGPEFARHVYACVGGATARGWQGIHALRLRFYVEQEMGQGRSKEEMIEALLGTPRHLEAPDMRDGLLLYRRIQQRQLT
jgi:hypothetical protein